MKKAVLVILLNFFFSASLLHAQQFHAGVKAGVSATQISGDQLSGFNKAGIVAGGFVGMELSDKFNLTMEILYFQKGSRKNADPENNDFVSYLLRLNYFEIPLVLQWKFSKRFTLEAGPSVAVLVGSYEEDEFGELNQPREFEDIEVGVIGGLKVEIVKPLAFNIRYQNSLLPVRDHFSGQDYRLNSGQYNTALLFALQYTFSRSKNE
jgi:hypothetical protein